MSALKQAETESQSTSKGSNTTWESTLAVSRGQEMKVVGGNEQITKPTTTTKNRTIGTMEANEKAPGDKHPQLESSLNTMPRKERGTERNPTYRFLWGEPSSEAAM